MDFVKKNLFLLICGVVGLASVGIMIWQITSMGQVTDAMQSVARIESSLSKFSGSKAVNPEMVQREYDRVDLVQEYHKKLIEHFAGSTEFKPLMENLLPDPPPGEAGKLLRYEFRFAYQNGMRDLLKTLRAGSPPTRADVEHVADYLRKKEMEAKLTTDSTAGQKPAIGTVSPVRPGGALAQKKPDMPPMDGPASVEAYWTALAEQAGSSPDMIASISNARAALCYANVDLGGSFELHPLFLPGDAEPRMKQIWTAQLWYWLQRDVVDRLASVNNDAASKVQGAWVGTSPVKHVKSIRISDYIKDEAPAKRGVTTDSPTTPPVNKDLTFTGTFRHNLWEVINLRLVVVVDVRDLPSILEALTHDSYSVVLDVDYSEIARRLDFNGIVYGPEPIVEATIDLQAYLSNQATVPLQPQVIRDALGTQPFFDKLVKTDDEEEEGEG
jgi:hypothetical protein